MWMEAWLVKIWNSDSHWLEGQNYWSSNRGIQTEKDKKGIQTKSFGGQKIQALS